MSDIAPLVLTITTAGLTLFAQAQGSDDIDLTIATVGVTAQAFVVAPTLTAVPGEIKRLDTVSGIVQENAVVHLVAQDSSADAYSIAGFGLYLADGTLFAVYGQAAPIMQKSAATFADLILDLRFPTVDATQITFGDATFMDPPASETTTGVAKVASQAVVDAGADDRTFVTPLKLATRLANLLAGLYASTAETIAGVITNKAVQPAGLLAALDARLGAGSPSTFVKSLLSAVSATTARATLGLGNVATLNVGAGNGIDADKLDSFEGASYVRLADSGTNANGSWRSYADGFIEQRGRAGSNISSGQTVAVTYPVPFTQDEPVVVTQIIDVDGDANDAIFLNVTTHDRNGFTAKAYQAGSGTASIDAFYWRAEGN